MHQFLKTLIRPHYLNLEGYVSAGMESDKATDKIFLNANENPYELPGLEGANRYPEPQPKALRDGYATLYNTPANNIIMTRGADEAIAILTKLFCEPKQNNILICPPTFGMYGVNARSMPANVVEAPLLKENGTFKLDVKTIIETDAKLIYLCSPNNPTATSFAAEDITRIIKAVEGRSVVIVDETYIEFARQADSFVKHLADHPNLIILRTLSKSYAMAGQRMGCLITNDTNLADLIRAKCLDAYPLPHASINAALHVMKPDIQKIAQNNIAKIIAERTRMETALQASPLITHIYPSDANFLLIESPRAQDLLAACAAQNIILRDFSSKAGTENCLRLSIGRTEDNNKVLNILENLL